MPETILPRRWLLILACVVILSGCTSLKVLPTIPMLPGSDDKPQQPANIVALWSDMVVHDPNGQPARGFGGRLSFYTAKGNKPVRVDGGLVVYGFEEQGESVAKVKPDKKFVFTPEQFARHYEKTRLGHSYVVWVPWDAAGGSQKEVSLIVRFTPKGGQLVVGEPTRHVLPGPPADPVAGESKMARAGRGRQARDGAVQQVSYEMPAPVGPYGDPTGQSGAQGMRITTIPVTDEMALQMRSGAPGRVDRPPTAGFRPPAFQTMPTGASLPPAPGAAAPRRAAGFTAPPAARMDSRPADPQSAYYRPGPPRVPGGPIVPPNRDRAGSPQRLGALRYPSHGSTPPPETPPAAGPAWSTQTTAPDSPPLVYGAGTGSSG
jgi:hypothetical protein